jgi:NAD(P)-dependent dehydrogenase (short-subunit alcohol dehydrogenase family)
MKLKGKTARVTGAGPNIGQEICAVLAREGAAGQVRAMVDRVVQLSVGSISW